MTRVELICNKLVLLHLSRNKNTWQILFDNHHSIEKVFEKLMKKPIIFENFRSFSTELGFSDDERPILATHQQEDESDVYFIDAGKTLLLCNGVADKCTLI